MKATVFYLHLTDDQRDEINAKGWDCELGKQYLKIRFAAEVDDTNAHLYTKAAVLHRDDAEEVWRDLQNLDISWCDANDIECHTDFQRSMDVGAVIVWDNGRAEICASIGFDEFTRINDITERLTHSDTMVFTEAQAKELEMWTS